VNSGETVAALVNYQVGADSPKQAAVAEELISDNARVGS
jgi:hypothetical protein